MAEPNTRSIRFLRLERTSEQVRKQLALVDQIAGVQGWMVGTRLGEVLFTSMLSILNLRLLDTIGNHVIRTSAELIGGESTTDLEINFTQGNLIARKIGNGWLIVFCDHGADLAMVRITLGVTVAALISDRSLQADLSSPVKTIPSDSGAPNPTRG